MKKTKRFSKYHLYEKSVQSPKTHIDWFVEIYKDVRSGKYARVMREDFCGTFQMSCEWVKRNRNNVAIGIDLDPEPLAYGRANHMSKLKPAQLKRLRLLQADVTKVKAPSADLIIVGNFSFNIFKSRLALVRYFRACLRGLSKDGVVLLEMAGGPGMTAPIQERKSFFSRGKKLFTYIWHQRSFNPISHEARYSIHFQYPDGLKLKDAFTYDWRLWTIPEVREALEEAGFKETVVYWESTHDGKGTGEYLQTEDADNAFAYITYVLGLK